MTIWIREIQAKQNQRIKIIISWIVHLYSILLDNSHIQNSDGWKSIKNEGLIKTGRYDQKWTCSSTWFVHRWCYRHMKISTQLPTISVSYY